MSTNEDLFEAVQKLDDKLNEHVSAETPILKRTDERLGKREKWHAGKEIPLATIAVLIAQTVGVIWWAASTEIRVVYQEKAFISQQAIQTSIDTRQDADNRRAEDRITTQITGISQKLDRLIEGKQK